ncbi:hypothetical protein AHAS_Ahas10G0058500 [Arachis hypogaea]
MAGLITGSVLITTPEILASLPPQGLPHPSSSSTTFVVWSSTRLHSTIAPPSWSSASVPGLRLLRRAPTAVHHAPAAVRRAQAPPSSSSRGA